MTNAQLELSLVSPRPMPSLRSNRRSSALSPQWWFRRMRQVVDRAFDWQAAPPARPEQIWLPGTHHQVHLNA